MADNYSHAGSRISGRSRRGAESKMIGMWKLGRTIGKGSSGRVKIAKHVVTGQHAAVKIVSKKELISSRMSMARAVADAEKAQLYHEREIVIMKLVDHPNILKLYDVWETKGELYLIMEYVEGGELFDLLADRGRLPADEALHYFQQIMHAIDYCHQLNIAHRDLKPENLLLDKDRNIKVADFGMAIWEGVGALKTSCGSPHYASPEVVEGRSYHGATSDIWSCGVVLYALLTGGLPFNDDDLPILCQKIKAGKVNIPSDVNPGARDLISRMLQTDVTKRIAMADILQHPWFTSRPIREMKGSSLPPSLDVVGPVLNRDDIDDDLLHNLRVLRHGAPDEEIISSLTSSERTWEKTIYHLLLRYRDRDTSNEELVPQPKERTTLRSHTPTQFKSSTSQQNPSSPLAERPAPPTPRRAMRNAVMTPESPMRSVVPSGLESSALTQLTSPARPTGPRHPRKQGSATTPRAYDAKLGSRVGEVPLLEMPELEAESVQRFFRQVADHLNTMQVRQSVVVVEDSDGGQAKIVLAPLTEASQDDRFADADDDDSVNNLAMGSPVSAMGSSPWPGYVNMPSTLREPRVDIRSTIATKPANVREDKENVRSVGTTKPSRHGGLKPLGDGQANGALTEQKRVSDGNRSPVMFQKPVSRTLKKRRGGADASPALSDGSFAAYDEATPKQSWFNSIFKLKISKYVLLSVFDAGDTRQECAKLLMALGVDLTSVAGEVLKCRVEDVGADFVLRFRVEVHGIESGTAHADAGYVTVMTMIQEKGPVSEFRNVYNRLRRGWDLDGVPRTPTGTPVSESASFDFEII